MIMLKISQIKDYILYDFIYMKLLEKAKFYKQRIDQGLPGAEGGSKDVSDLQEETFQGARVFRNWILMMAAPWFIFTIVLYTSLGDLHDV